MAKTPKNRGVNVPMPDDKKEQLRQVAKQRGYSGIAAYIRALVTADAGIEFDIERWGGARELKGDEE
jgi:hypothetical protein